MKKIIIIVLAIILLGGLGYFGYRYFIKDDTTDETVKAKEKQYVLNKITDWTDNSVEFYDAFVAYEKGYVLKYRTNDNQTKVIIFDNNGKVITNTLYKFDSDFEFFTITDDIFQLIGKVNGKDKCIVVNTNFEIIIDKDNCTASVTSEEKYLVVHDTVKDLYGLYDFNGKELIAISYEYLYGPSDTNYLFAQKNGKTGVIDVNNKILVPFEYDNFLTKNMFYNAKPIGKNNENILIPKNGVERIIDINNKEIINIDADSKNYSIVDINYSSKDDIYYATFDKESGEHSLVKIYDGTGKYIKDIELGNTYKLRRNFYKENKKLYSYITFIDNSDISYKLDSSYELEKIGKLYCIPNEATGSIYDCNYGSGVTVKVSDNNKYVIYDNNDNKLVDKEFAMIKFLDDYVYACLEKINDYTGNNCGYFDYSGKVLFDFKYDGESNDKVFELSNGELYAASLEKIVSKVGKLEANTYFMPVKDFVIVDSRENNNTRRDLYNVNGELLLDNIYNAYGIMNDKFISIEYYDGAYSTKIYNANDMKASLYNDVKLIEMLFYGDNKRVFYSAEDGIYELVEK